MEFKAADFARKKQVNLLINLNHGWDSGNRKQQHFIEEFELRN